MLARNKHTRLFLEVFMAKKKILQEISFHKKYARVFVPGESFFSSKTVAYYSEAFHSTPLIALLRNVGQG